MAEQPTKPPVPATEPPPPQSPTEIMQSLLQADQSLVQGFYSSHWGGLPAAPLESRMALVERRAENCVIAIVEILRTLGAKP